MPTYTAIPDANLEPGKPARSVDAILLRDNPLAIIEGDATAPRIDPINAMEHQGALGAVGTYAYLMRDTLSSGITAGNTYAGSGLEYYGFRTNGVVGDSEGGNRGGAPSGTWRAMGYCDSETGRYPSTVFLRIS